MSTSQPPSSNVGKPTEVHTGGELLRGNRPGDVHLRVRRPPSERVELPSRGRPRPTANAALIFLLGFASFIAVGTVALALPLASTAGRPTPLLDALFTATSAVCVTGLVVYDTASYWSGFGQAVILVLIQLGGLGFMTSSTVLLLLLRREATLRERVLMREAQGNISLGVALALARRVLLFTAIAELLGGLVLTAWFSGQHGLPEAAWLGVFHAVSAFNNAGFDLMGGFRSLTPYSSDAVLLLTIATLLILGGLSYTVINDLGQRRRFTRLSVDSKLVLLISTALLLGGALGLWWVERNNPATLGSMSFSTGLLNAFFQSATARTAGFNSIAIGQMTETGLLLLMLLMFIGGASGSTAGGIKVQTAGILALATLSAIRGATEVVAFRRKLPLTLLLRAIAIALLSLALVLSVALALRALEPFHLSQVFFEAFSAFGTVGLSTGITPETSPGSRLLLAGTMFVGRLGPLTLALALAARERRRRFEWPEEEVKIG